MSNNAHDLSNRLLNALDNNYNVVDMHAVNEIISILEKINITKELLETTRLGKHVNELRRKTSDPTLARRAKVLVKRWRDLVIPSVASPGHTGSNRSSAERQVRRLGGTPLTSPALSRVVSPAVNSPRPPSRPAWGGYESDSQDVILVDDEPAPPPPPAPLAPLAPLAVHKPLTPPVKRAISPVPVHDEKKAKRDKKPKKRRGHSRAGSGTETPAGGGGVGGAGVGAGAVPTGAGAATWPARNGTAAPERRRNGYKRDQLDPYAALVNRMPPAGAKKVKTTQELLEEIQSRGSRVNASPSPPHSPASPDVMLIEPDPCPIKVESPLRNGGSEPRVRVPTPAVESAPGSPMPPLEDERPYYECTCDPAVEGSTTPVGSSTCPAAVRGPLRPRHVHALHHALLPGVNGTRAPALPHKFAVRKPEHSDWPGLFASVVPLYKYSDYADDYCVKNMSSVTLTDVPWTEFAPLPPSPPSPPPPPSPRPYPVDEPTEAKVEPEPPPPPDIEPASDAEPVVIGPEPVGAPALEPSERLKPPILSNEDERQFGKAEPVRKPDVVVKFENVMQEHRTVEKTKETEELDGRALVAQCERARASVPWEYGQLASAPEVALNSDAPEGEAESSLRAALARAAEETERDELGRPERASRFAEWHECARLGDLIALPYVVID